MLRWLLVLMVLPLPARAEEQLWSERSQRGRSSRRADFVKLARDVAPAVVNVSVRFSEDKAPGQAAGPTGPESVGSGFVIRKDGLTLTGYHVVEGGRSIRVRTVDGREYEASVIGGDERTDLALLKIRAPRPLPVVPLGDSERLEIGEWVMAIGNPLGLEHTVTVGIVSAKGRRELPVERDLYQDFIQTDASINPGSSGGPLVNARGEVVGIAAAVNRAAQGIGFATPINMAKALLPQLHADGRVRRSWIGIRVQPGDLTPSLQRAFQLRRPEGALVTEVIPGSPGARAGLRPGDVVVKLGDRRVVRAGDLRWLASMAGIGRRVTLKVIRGGKTQPFEIDLAEMPEEPSALPAAEPPKPRRAVIGVTVAEVGKEMARVLRLDGRLVVTGLESGGAAESAGVQTGDVVLQVNDSEVLTVDQYFSALRSVRPGDLIRLLLRRRGDSLWVAFPKGS